MCYFNVSGEDFVGRMAQPNGRVNTKVWNSVANMWTVTLVGCGVKIELIRPACDVSNHAA